SRGPIGVPRVTTGNPASPNGGAIGDPGTVVLFGNSNVNFGPLLGGRLSTGYWFDCDAKCGIEASGFLLAKKHNTFRASSDVTGNPLLALPFQTPGGVERRTLISSPTIPQTGSVVITTTTRLWGTDFNGVWNVYRDCPCSIDVLAGFRYLDFEEPLEIDPSSTVAPAPTTVRGDGFKIVTTITTQTSGFDHFSTRNQFYGGQVGARAGYHDGRYSAEILGMFSMGGTVQTLYTGGSSTSTTTKTV